MKPLMIPGIFLILFGTCGCVLKSPMSAWQNTVEHYVAEVGNDDPNVLRETLDLHARDIQRPGRITFGGSFLDPDNRRSTKLVTANGVLLDVREIESRHWFLFLVGISDPKTENLEDVRLAGFTSDKNKLRWRVADSDQDTVRKYLSVLPADSGGTVFPSPMDVYELEIHGYLVKVEENRSGAEWELDLED